VKAGDQGSRTADHPEVAEQTATTRLVLASLVIVPTVLALGLLLVRTAQGK